MNADKSLKMRCKIIRLFDRNELEKLSGMSSPWLANADTLRHAVAVKWPEDQIKAQLEAMMKVAKL